MLWRTCPSVGCAKEPFSSRSFKLKSLRTAALPHNLHGPSMLSYTKSPAEKKRERETCASCLCGYVLTLLAVPHLLLQASPPQSLTGSPVAFRSMCLVFRGGSRNSWGWGGFPRLHTMTRCCLLFKKKKTEGEMTEELKWKPRLSIYSVLVLARLMHDTLKSEIGK